MRRVQSTEYRVQSRKRKTKRENKIQNIRLPNLRFNQGGLIPVIIQDKKSKDVLMMAYMNRQSLKITLREKRTCFYSRSRKLLWRKGETSGNIQKVKEIYYDCDSDTLLIKVEQLGTGACHTGKWSCFYRKII